jgi:hypothetical protein
MDPGALCGLLFVAYAFLLLPWMALRATRTLSAARATGEGAEGSPSTEQILVSTLFSLAVLLAFAWITASAPGLELMWLEPFGPRAALATAIAFALHLVMLWVSRIVRSEAEQHDRRGATAQGFANAKRSVSTSVPPRRSVVTISDASCENVIPLPP